MTVRQTTARLLRFCFLLVPVVTGGCATQKTMFCMSQPSYQYVSPLPDPRPARYLTLCFDLDGRVRWIWDDLLNASEEK